MNQGEEIYPCKINHNSLVIKQYVELIFTMDVEMYHWGLNSGLSSFHSDMHVTGIPLQGFILYYNREMSPVVQKLNIWAGVINCHNTWASENMCMCISVCVCICKFADNHPCLTFIRQSVDLEKGIKMW